MRFGVRGDRDEIIKCGAGGVNAITSRVTPGGNLKKRGKKQGGGK